MTICYQWEFTVALLMKSGRKRNAHSVLALGSKYSDAHFDMTYKLKKRGAQLISVVKVRVMGIAFAWDDNYKYIQPKLADCMPPIPENLNLNELKP
ncbi:hypothetical protein [Niabella beijingensis]|uniref:hypothetical protein n=1 Tax=Niabella beijingensis TaxID=2872700 RepID=UPI001CBEC436|nr:hypothetical protein [Niabella beijingensis]MBZ4187662.1 hypothetical protein [Niabella beijingensis]